MIAPTDPTIKVTEPGRTPIHLVVRRPIEIGRGCDGLLLADAQLRRAGSVTRAGWPAVT